MAPVIAHGVLAHLEDDGGGGPLGALDDGRCVLERDDVERAYPDSVVPSGLNEGAGLNKRHGGPPCDVGDSPASVTRSIRSASARSTSADTSEPGMRAVQAVRPVERVGVRWAVALDTSPP